MKRLALFLLFLLLAAPCLAEEHDYSGSSGSNYNYGSSYNYSAFNFTSYLPQNYNYNITPPNINTYMPPTGMLNQPVIPTSYDINLQQQQMQMNLANQQQYFKYSQQLNDMSMQSHLKDKPQAQIRPQNFTPVQTSNFPVQTANFPMQTSNIPAQTANISVQTDNTPVQTSDIQESDLEKEPVETRQ
jgi:hypothetical protein